jgi:hypothetical protein
MFMLQGLIHMGDALMQWVCPDGCGRGSHVFSSADGPNIAPQLHVAGGQPIGLLAATSSSHNQQRMEWMLCQSINQTVQLH